MMKQPVQIKSKIKSVTVLKDEPPQLEVLGPKLRRPEVLEAKVYKLRSPLAEASLYITISDIVLNKGTPHESRRPYEIFINSKEVSNAQWVVLVTRLISMYFREGLDPQLILDELKAIYDPRGGYLSKQGYVPSLVAEIGLILEKHLNDAGLIHGTHTEVLEQKKAEFAASGQTMENAEVCPKCHAKTYVNSGGCRLCHTCGYSVCG